MNLLASTRHQAIILTGLSIALVVSVTNFSPFESPIFVPIVVALVGLISLLTMIVIKNQLSIKVSTSTLVHLNIIIAVLLALFSLHQLKLTDIVLVFGLYLLLRIYSNR